MLRLAIAVGSVLLTVAVLAAFSAVIEGPMASSLALLRSTGGEYAVFPFLLVLIGGSTILSMRANRRDLRRQLAAGIIQRPHPIPMWGRALLLTPIGLALVALVVAVVTGK